MLKLVDFAPAENKCELKKFVGFPWKIYSNDPAWVPPLRLQVLDNLDTKKNPYYKNAEIRLWNAYQDGKHVGRIAAVVDGAHLKMHKDECGFFGFFEVVNDLAVARALVDAAKTWLKQKGMKHVRGPMNPSLNHEAGLLVKGFETPPYIMMTHNPPYYGELIEQLGLVKAKDLLAFEMATAQEFPERVRKIVGRVKEKSNISFRSINMKRFKDEVKIIKDIYNDAWEDNWGFVPMTDEEFDHMAKGMKDVVWPDFCLLAYSAGEPIGFSLALPDINQVLKEIPNGKLLPFGIFKLLGGLNPKKKKINRVRVITLGVKKKFRTSGVGSLFYLESYDRAKRQGLFGGEMSWILEDNQQMLSALRAFYGDHPPYKTYRIYQQSL